MIINTHTNTNFFSVSYRLGSTLVDVGEVWDGFENVKEVLLTHAHFDHIYGLNKLCFISPQIAVYTNRYGMDMLLDAKKNLSLFDDKNFVFEHPEKIITIENGYEIDLLNGKTAKAVFTPGHNPSCITWVIGDNIFTGDSYIPGIKTVTNLPGSDKKQAEESIRIIKAMSYDKIIYPGHKICL